MFTAFSSALSALNATSAAIDTVGNNLANVNTTGFKASDVVFRDLVSQSFGVGSRQLQIGLGTNRPITTRHFTQGAIQSSPGALDAAIQGEGFFVVKDRQDNTLYTRNGSLQVDIKGNLMTHTGERIQGWVEANGAIDTSGPIRDIVIPSGALRQPLATDAFTLDANLNASGIVGVASGEFSAPLAIVDSLGSTHNLTVNFTKTASNEWTYQVTIPGEDVGGVAGTPTELATGPLVFTDGKLTSPDLASGVIPVPITGLANGAADLAINWNLYNAAGNARITQFNQASSPSAISPNGSAAAQLLQVAMDDGGRVVATFSSGQQMLVGQLAMANIRNPGSLVSVGDNNYQTTADTASPTVGLPETGGRGKIVGSALESSNVDIAREFTNLIVFQRGYQANSRVITTVDELSQETLNIKR